MKARHRAGALAVAAVLSVSLIAGGCGSNCGSPSHPCKGEATSTLPSVGAPATSTTVDDANSPGEPASAVVAAPSAAPALPYPHDAYHPNLSITPGAVFTGVTSAQVCVSGYSASVRNVTAATKTKVFAEYGITNPAPGAYEVDHLVSLELGGSNDIRNLWPEPYTGPDNAHVKDTYENELHAQMCAGTITLQAAQIAIIYWDQISVPAGPPVGSATATPAPAPTTVVDTVRVPTVTGGAFCTPVGAQGLTTAGTPQVCSLTSVAGTPYKDGRARWHTP